MLRGWSNCWVILLFIEYKNYDMCNIRPLLIPTPAELISSSTMIETWCCDNAHLSLVSLFTPSTMASWLRLCSCWAGMWGAWLCPASRSVLMCSCCRLWRTWWYWSTVLRRFLSTSTFTMCSFFTAFFWALSNCSHRKNKGIAWKLWRPFSFLVQFL